MKIGRPTVFIPIRRAAFAGVGRKRNPVYDKLAKRILALSNTKALPVTCETKSEVDSFS